MKVSKKFKIKKFYKKNIILLFLFSLYFFPLNLIASEDDYDTAINIINTSNTALNKLKKNEELIDFPQYLRNSKAILIFPEIYEGGLIFGAKGGNGILFVRNNKEWSGPFFYTMGGLSFGLQIGVKSGKVAMTVMSPRGLKSILKERVKIGVDVDAAVGNGIGYSAESTIRLADIFSFSDNKGLFLGGSFEGSYLQPREDLNLAIHKKKFNHNEIINKFVIHNSSKKIITTLNSIESDRK